MPTLTSKGPRKIRLRSLIDVGCSSMPRRWLAMNTCLVAAAALVSGCTSTTDKTDQTHKPVHATTAASRPSVVAFFAHDGAPLVAFERATASLATGSRPDRSTCVHLRDVVLPKISKSPDSLVALARRIPDKRLSGQFHTVLSLKIIVVLGCATGAAPTSATDPQGFTSIRDDARRLDATLAQFGITI